MEDILDEHPEGLPPAPPWWPSLLMGGLGGGAIVLVFGRITNQGGPVAIVYLIVTFIVLNSTLTHYRSKLHSNQSYVTAISLCFGTYLLMIATNFVATYMLFGGSGYDFSFNMYEPLRSIGTMVAGGFVVSAVAAFLSKKYHQQ